MPIKCLVVTAHPLKDSLCKQLTAQVVKQLSDMGHEVQVEDLYEQGFEPTLTVAERESYYNGPYDQSGVAEQTKRLQEAEALFLLFPTWWFSFPAMLKGWFDRVWAPGVAYDHADDYGSLKPRLNNLKKVLVVTTLGSPRWVDRLIMHRPVKRVVRLALIGACARQAKLKYLSLYNCEKLSEQEIERFSREIEKSVVRLVG